MSARPKSNKKPIHRQIDESAGMKFINRSYNRTFTLNIFEMNALELMESTRRIRDPDQGIFLMSQNNKDEGHQFHREINRHVHNFVASAKTLVDHTRVFMKENYEGSPVLASYNEQVQKIFANDPASKFVHDLRNYMLHKGLPNSEMFLNFTNDPDKGDAGFTTGVRIPTESLLEWSSWTAPARKYISSFTDYMDVHRFVEEYLAQVKRFQAWLDNILNEHHSSDLEELSRLRDLQSEIEKKNTNTENADRAETNLPSAYESDGETRPLPGNEANINDKCESLFSKIKELKFSRRPQQGFASERHVSSKITDGDFVGTPIFWGTDANGDYVVAFIRVEDRPFGLLADDFSDIEPIVEEIQKTDAYCNAITGKFIEEIFIAWAQDSFKNDNKSDFMSFLKIKALEEITSFEIIAPIAHLEVESEIEFGPVKIIPITAAKINSIEAMVKALASGQSGDAGALFDKLRNDIQGLASVSLKIEAESNFASEYGLIVAEDAVSIFRFFSPAADDFEMLCPTALIGNEIVPRSTILLVGDERFSMSDSIRTKDVAFWRIPSSDMERLDAMGLKQAGSLVSPAFLDEFSAAVRSSIITYGKGTTSSDPIDRLAHAISALEGVLLRHRTEPVVSNMADRMSFLLSKDEGVREQITKHVRDAYRLASNSRNRILHPHERNLLANFTRGVHQVLRIALRSVGKIQDRFEFINEVERLQ